MAAAHFEIPRQLRRGGKLGDVEASVNDARKILAIIYRELGVSNLGNTCMLDMGCGWRMAKMLLDDNLPVAQYVGMDVFAQMIEFLRDNVRDPRFSFYILDSHNAMYNPQGKPLAELPGLPIPEASVDVITLFSVFTHLAPHDYVAMLRLLRPYIKPGGKLIFSLFVNETTQSGLGFTDQLALSWKQNSEQAAQYQKTFETHYKQQGVPDFIDFDKSQPLRWALYSRRHALELIEGTGWKVQSLNDPEEAIQHCMVCTPI